MLYGEARDERERDRDTGVKCEGRVGDAEWGRVADPPGTPDVGVGSEGRAVGQRHGGPGDASDFSAVDGDGGRGWVDVGPEVGL